MHEKTVKSGTNRIRERNRDTTSTLTKVVIGIAMALLLHVPIQRAVHERIVFVSDIREKVHLGLIEEHGNCNGMDLVIGEQKMNVCTV